MATHNLADNRRLFQGTIQGTTHKSGMPETGTY